MSSVSSKESTCQCRIQVQSLGGEASREEGNSNPLQYSRPGNYMDRGAWQAIVCGVAESDRTEWLSTAQMQIKYKNVSYKGTSIIEL